MSVLLHAPQPRRYDHVNPERMLQLNTPAINELARVAQHLSTPDIILKPTELHLAFNWGVLRSRKYSRFQRIKLSAGRPRYGPRPSITRSSTVCSIMSMTRTLITDVGVLITHPVRRESTYIVWGALMAVNTPTAAVPPRRVLVKIAIDEEGGEDLREDARLHDHLVERGLALGYYGLYVDKIGSTALVIDDFDDEFADVKTPRPTPSP